MQRLSSCYFCGVALDESLSEYPVVPERLGPDEDDQRTVVLCSSCRRKLGTILDTVVSTAQADSAADTAPADTADLDESGMDAQPDPMALSDANETVAEDYPDRDILDRAEADEAEAASADGDVTDDVASDDGATDDEADSDERTGTERSEGESDGDETERESASEADPSESATEEPDPELTRLEYSKVMRLLQNRAFPVDRAEIRQVAVNAYDIDPEQFDAITDLAIERDLINEENGQFVSPE